jgi:threonine/homoserine/homoserine lactone efflux protein
MPGLRLLVKGLLLGFSVAAPVGAIGVMVVRRTLAHGHLVGLASGLGAATADAIYGSVAGFGLTFVVNVLTEASVWIRLLGGLSLVYLGITALARVPNVSSPYPQVAASKAVGLARAYGSTLLLTLANPVPVVAFIGIMAGVDVGSAAGTYGRAAALAGGVFLGSALWWVILSTVVSMLRPWFVRPRTFRWINLVSGLVIAGFGLVTLVQLVLGPR